MDSEEGGEKGLIAEARKDGSAEMETSQKRKWKILSSAFPLFRVFAIESVL
jgi:hypothetical protein